MEEDRDFDKNKKELLDRLEAMRQKVKDEAFARDSAAIVVFAQKSPFIEGLVKTLEKKHLVRFFFNVDEACSFCIDHKSAHVILDMDPPTDWKMSTDVFTTVKTVNPGARFILCTKTPGSTEVQTLAAQKAEVLALPFSAEALFRKLKSGPPV
jgi:hypothetical protein